MRLWVSTKPNQSGWIMDYTQDANPTEEGWRLASTSERAWWEFAHARFSIANWCLIFVVAVAIVWATGGKL